MASSDSGPATANGTLANMSLEDIESQIANLQLLKSQKLAEEAESKKPKKDRKKEKAGKIEVKVPKVTTLTPSTRILTCRAQKVQ